MSFNGLYVYFYKMKHWESKDYQKVNESFRCRLVYHVGKEYGFFVELNYMLNAMIYCLSRRIQFQIYSADANFGTGIGWTEYFQPFCKEVHEAYHAKYNFHRPPSWKQVLKEVLKQHSLKMGGWKTKMIVKTMVGRIIGLWTYHEKVLLSQDIQLRTDRHFSIPELGIEGDYYHVFGILARMIWQPQSSLQQQMANARLRLSLPKAYSGVQIRRGDKVAESRLISGWQIIRALHPKDGDCIFVLTDSYLEFEKVKNEFPQLRFVTLCQPNETGYYHQEFIHLQPQEKKESIIRLLASVDILLHCSAFVGTITSGPSVFLMKVRVDDPYVTAIDCPQDMLLSCLSLNIDDRAIISQKYMKQDI